MAICDDARMTVGTNAFRAARDLLLLHRTEYESARLEFAWRALNELNWALDRPAGRTAA
jgi:acetyl-CoA synthetase